MRASVLSEVRDQAAPAPRLTEPRPGVSTPSAHSALPAARNASAAEVPVRPRRGDSMERPVEQRPLQVHGGAVFVAAEARVWVCRSFCVYLPDPLHRKFSSG